ncbi:MAG: hypothetical protein DRJ18_02110, partial [Candidatus Methanomethylicota archaeon]
DFGGIKVRFFKVRKSLLNFGFTRVGNLNVADVERAVLDILYITLPSNPNPKEWSYIVAGFLKPCRKEKLLEYLKHYPKKRRKGGKVCTKQNSLKGSGGRYDYC